MRAGIEITVRPEDRARLEAIARDRNAAQKHVARARVILATADGCGTMEVMRRSGLSKPAVWRWRERFMHQGVNGLLRDKTRPPGKPRLPDETVRRVLDLTLSEPPGEATHWTGRMVAKVSGVSLRSVQRIWAAHGLEPHRIRTFKLSRDPLLAERLKCESRDLICQTVSDCDALDHVKCSAFFRHESPWAWPGQAVKPQSRAAVRQGRRA